jgi:chromosome segregation ATPase
MIDTDDNVIEEKIDKFERLNLIVEKLLSNFNELKSEKESLEQTLNDKEEMVKSLQEKISFLEQDKSTIHNRVVGLINTIEDWEKSHILPSENEVNP